MILKGSQRANGADLAIHLMNGFDNEHVEIAEVYGAVADDLFGAFAEFESIALGTRARDYLYSLSINPSAPLTRAQYQEAIGEIERRLGLSGQPRAVVFHVKDGREHCHVVWSRINAESMKAVHMAHDRRRLMDISCELARKFGLELPPGLKAWEAKQKFEKEALSPTLAENAQAAATGITPKQRRAEITACYEQSDSAAAFRAALAQKGYVLARGDRRGFVVVDRFGNPHSLTRYVKGHKAAAIKGKLAGLDPADLPDVAQAKEIVRRRERARKRREEKGVLAADLAAKEEAKRQRREERARKEREALASRHAERRAALLQAEQELLTRQQAEKLALDAAQMSESSGLLFRMRSAVADLIGRTPALRSVLGPLQKMTKLDPRERHSLERWALARRHGRERGDIERQKRMLLRLEKRESRSLEKALERSARLVRAMEGKARQDFHEAARDPVVRKATDMDEGDLSVAFNDSGEFVEGAGRSDEDEQRAPSWKKRSENLRRGRRPRRGKGYSSRSES
mgnify:CR=1 FL=1